MPFLQQLSSRIGGNVAPSNLELEALSQEIESEASKPQSSPDAQAALRAVDELRNEFSSLRSECDGLRRLLSERESEIAGMRSTTDLRQRVEQLEDRLV